MLVQFGVCSVVENVNFFVSSEGSGNPDLLKTKKSELRLYCDLLMQQVHTVKSSAMEKSPPDIDVS